MNKTKRQKIWKQYYLKNKESLLLKSKIRRESNPEHYKKYEKDRYAKNPEFYKNRHKEYSKNNRDKINKYIRNRYHNNLQFKLKCVMRARLLIDFKGKQKSDRTLQLIGCTIPELKVYIENKFKPGMNWTNWVYKGWHIDHIKPIAKFDLSKHEELLKCFHYTNLQPLWSVDNHSKGDRLDFQEKLTLNIE